MAMVTAKPEAVGLSAARLSRLTRFFEEKYVAPSKIPCAVTLVHRRGETVHLGLAGHADIDRNVPVAPDTIFRIYSMTKPITSVALMMLYEEGAFQLDDPVAKFIPEWRNLGVYAGGFMETFQSRPAARPMLMVDLLRHTSGLTYGFQQRTNVDAAYRRLKIGEIELSGTLDSMIAGLAGVPLEFSPGDHWNYSVSTDVCGYLVGKLSGMPFDAFLARRIFEPLGMRDTGFYVPDTEIGRFAACYAATPDGKMVQQDDPKSSSYLHPPSFMSGGGGLVSTAADYLAFCKMLLAGGEAGGTRLLSPKTIALMTSNHLPGGKSLTDMSVALFSEAAYQGIGFGLGFAVTHNPAAAMLPGSVGEYFWGGAASTAFFVDPAEDLIVIFFTQLLPSTRYAIRRELRTLVYSSLAD